MGLGPQEIKVLPFYLSLNQTGDLSFFTWYFTWEALLCRYPSSCPLWNNKIIFSSVRENVRSRCLNPPSTSAYLGNRTLRSHPPKDIFHIPNFSRGMLHRVILFIIHYSHAHSRNIYFQHKQGESHVSNTGCVQPSGRDEYVHVVGHSLELQVRYGRDCTDKILLSACSSACSFGHWRPHRLQEGNFWEERELSSGHSPGWCAKTLDGLGLSWLRP